MPILISEKDLEDLTERFIAVHQPDESVRIGIRVFSEYLSLFLKDGTINFEVEMGRDRS